MKVELLTSRVTDYSTHRAGDVLELPDDEAQRMIARELAVAVDGSARGVAPQEARVETTAFQPGQNAARAKAAKRTR